MDPLEREEGQMMNVQSNIMHLEWGILGEICLLYSGNTTTPEGIFCGTNTLRGKNIIELGTVEWVVVARFQGHPLRYFYSSRLGIEYPEFILQFSLWYCRRGDF